MSMLRRITSIIDLRNKLQEGIVCLTDTNEEGEICHAYLTTNIELIGFFGFTEDKLECESELLTEDVTVAFNILEGKSIDLQLSIYTGYAHQIAELSMPDNMFQSELLKLNTNNFVDDDGYPADFLKVLFDVDEFNLVFCSADEKGQQINVVEVNEFGMNEHGIGTIFNAKGAKLIERDGYILISEKSEPAFIRKENKDMVQLVGKSKLLSAIGLIDNKEHLRSVVLLANPE